MTNHITLELNTSNGDDLTDAIDNAADQDRSTILAEDGQPIAAVVPIEVLEYYDKTIDNLSRLGQSRS